MCDCVDKIKAELCKQYGVGGVEHVSPDGRIYVTGWFRPKTKSGNYSKHNRYIGLDDKVKFCPFCGKPYDEKGK